MSGALIIAQERLGEAGLHALATIGASVSLVICPDKELNKRIVAPADIAAFCSLQAWNFLETDSIRNDFVLSRIVAAQPDLLYVIGWSEIISPAILHAISGPQVGFHGSLLPRHRGCAPIPWAILHGLRKSGMTMFYLTEGIDNGPIIAQHTFRIMPEDTAAHLYDKSCKALFSLIVEQHGAVLSNDPGLPQDEQLASYWPRRKPRDGLMDWSATAVSLHAWVRAQTSPFPGAFTFFKGRKILVWASSIVDFDCPAGYEGIILNSGPEGVDVGTGEGTLRIIEAQSEEALLKGPELTNFFKDHHGGYFSF